MKRITLLLLVSILCGCALGPGPDEQPPENWSPEKKVSYYIRKLPDQSYVTYYGDEGDVDLSDRVTWHTAAEQLGQVGMPAIPTLMGRLDSTDPHERSLVLYALLLASQDDDLRKATKGDYIKVYAWDPKAHDKNADIAREWWSRWQHLWD